MPPFRLLSEKEEALRRACEEVRVKLVAEWREVVDKQHKDLSEKHAADLAKCKEQWDQEKQAEIAAKVAEIVSLFLFFFCFVFKSTLQGIFLSYSILASWGVLFRFLLLISHNDKSFKVIRL